MFLEVVRSEGLAHLSYVVGDSGEAAVIDPRRDCENYVDAAYRKGARITHIFETHRNEDYVIGSMDLARRTGAAIHHGKQMPFMYGNAVSEGDSFELGDVLLRVLETPGHTYESISIVLSDKGFSEEPVAVFTGDALFIGDVGRTDFFPDEAEKVAGLLYDSIFKTLLPLGDYVILYPAHGAGSVCGAGMASREFSTLGYERRHNPILQRTDRTEFIKYKVSEHHYKPPYFRQMEKYNLEGPPILEELPKPLPHNAEQFAKAMDGGMLVLDVRSPEAFAGAHIPASLAVPLDMLPAFAGWYLPYDKAMGLVVEDYEQIDTAARYLVRLGYDNITAYLEGGMHQWETSGRRYERLPAVHVEEIQRRLEANEEFTLLDVRSKDEFEKGHLSNAVNLYVGELPSQMDEIPRDYPAVTFCRSGRRAVIAASILKRNGFKEVEVSLGSMAACLATGCPVIT